MAYGQPLAQEKLSTGVDTHLKQIKDISITLVPWCSHPGLFVEAGLLGQTRIRLKVFQVIREPSFSNYKAVFKDLLIQLQWKTRGLHKELASKHEYGSNILTVAFYYAL